MGNMLTKADLKSTALKEPLAYVPEDDEEVDEIAIEDQVTPEHEGFTSSSNTNSQDPPEFGEQITLF